jgi:outer membrane protein TolC
VNAIVITRCWTWVRWTGAAAGLLLAGCAPQPDREQARAHFAELDLAAYQQRAPQIDGPLTLADALRLATNHNVEIWIAEQEHQFHVEMETQARLRLLPSLTLGFDSRERSELDVSSSRSFETERESLEPSYSSERNTRRYDIGTTWSLLDFGISFFRARQAGNRALIAEERERRVRQNIALEVVQAYWQAVTARAVSREAAHIAKEVDRQLAMITQEIDEQATPRVSGLKRQTLLLEQLEELKRYKRAYLSAKAKLATLIGLTPGTEFTLADVSLDAPPEPLDADVPTLERRALLERPELYEKDLEQLISRDEAYIAIARLFPNFSLLWRYDWNDNPFLVFNEWGTIGMRASWDLLAIPHQLQQHKALELQTDLLGRRRTAVAVAILTQLHLSLIEQHEAVEQHRHARRIADARRALAAAVESAASEGTSHAGEALEHRVRYLKAQARALSAHAGIMTARARLLNTLGNSLAEQADQLAPSQPATEENHPSAPAAALPEATAQQTAEGAMPWEPRENTPPRSAVR